MNDPLFMVYLLRTVLGCPSSRAAAFAGPMCTAMTFANVNTRLRIAAWLAQIGHESGRLRYMREIWGPTPQQRRYEPVTTLSKRLGNKRPGDGKRFMGRSPIQITGGFNYAATRDGLRALLGSSVPDFVAKPYLLELPEWGLMGSALYWRNRKLNVPADRGDNLTVTKLINGGINGLADRQMLYARALGVLTRY